MTQLWRNSKDMAAMRQFKLHAFYAICIHNRKAGFSLLFLSFLPSQSKGFVKSCFSDGKPCAILQKRVHCFWAFDHLQKEELS